MADLDAMKDKVVGKVKETTGKATGNEKLEAKGKAQGLKGEAKDKVADAKRKAKDSTDDLTEKAADKFNDTVDSYKDHH
ncbi:CsbD family protein [Lacticaseibacillus camelliae]|uniref:CsbD-like domain-containing protein n=1 Tax=Lacticaseibacillus camelliae DSM 22697 = JCM 13995 TaxID=1423730 RepID=A0A0R2FE90_9LACO|nr:CsbD family protein [Lacticaseibacillus camelliae]KRN22957.1 hypothetical protein FC75_GL001595 [Lacticaseibacillus camelliae DSM 22697 = JCM 13995]